MNLMTTALLNYTTKIKAKLNKIIADKDIIGSDGVPGTIYRNVFKGFIKTVTTAESGPSSTGDFPIPPTFTDDVDIYLHFRIPYNINADSKMFWVQVKGYSFGNQQIINTTAVGYSYAVQTALLSTQVVSTQPGELYTDTNGNVVLSIKFSRMYYLTLEIDTMLVGNSTAIKRGMLQVKYSKSNRVVF